MATLIPNPTTNTIGAKRDITTKQTQMQTNQESKQEETISINNAKIDLKHNTTQNINNKSIHIHNPHIVLIGSSLFSNSNNNINKMKQLFSTKCGYKHISIASEQIKNYNSDCIDNQGLNSYLNDISSLIQLNKTVDSLIIIYCGYGYFDQTNNSVICDDGKKRSLKQILDKFSPKNCNYLSGKPKIFYLNYYGTQTIDIINNNMDINTIPNDYFVHSVLLNIFQNDTKTSPFIDAIYKYYVKTHNTDGLSLHEISDKINTTIQKIALSFDTHKPDYKIYLQPYNEKAAAASENKSDEGANMNSTSYIYKPIRSWKDKDISEWTRHDFQTWVKTLHMEKTYEAKLLQVIKATGATPEEIIYHKICDKVPLPVSCPSLPYQANMKQYQKRQKRPYKRKQRRISRSQDQTRARVKKVAFKQPYQTSRSNREGHKVAYETGSISKSPRVQKTQRVAIRSNDVRNISNPLKNVLKKYQVAIQSQPQPQPQIQRPTAYTAPVAVSAPAAAQFSGDCRAVQTNNNNNVSNTYVSNNIGTQNLYINSPMSNVSDSSYNTFKALDNYYQKKAAMEQMEQMDQKVRAQQIMLNKIQNSNQNQKQNQKQNQNRNQPQPQFDPYMQQTMQPAMQPAMSPIAQMGNLMTVTIPTPIKQVYNNNNNNNNNNAMYNMILPQQQHQQQQQLQPQFGGIIVNGLNNDNQQWNQNSFEPQNQWNQNYAPTNTNGKTSTNKKGSNRNNWETCWAFNSPKGCKWGKSCRWKHVHNR